MPYLKCENTCSNVTRSEKVDLHVCLVISNLSFSPAKLLEI